MHAAARQPNRSQGLLALLENHTEHLRLHPCDVSSDASVAALVKEVGAEVDWVINNAGTSGDKGSLNEMDLGSAHDVLEVNALSAIRVSRAFLPALRAGQEKKLLHLTSEMGSLADNRSGGWVAYRMSKAALNMASKCMSVEWRGDKIVSVVLHPGWVQTDMGGAGAPVSPSDSVSGMLRVIDGLTLEQSGRFFDYRGEEVPW